ncbi:MULTISPECIES: NAD(P) transhydrogenase subunit alpha [Desulfovibrio]|uniref:proton-translocating NAD(P)(+) transhydrogenase n=4 Tax=Desulfovibrio TaxID=872 RepID=B8J2K5_DESDA|nr:NAD(P) transhydrogenase subunit alpha [Desulfovibrio sp. G11]MDY0204568.1 NAD(P) transhydrogenase subunit alpha [Desulfovibrio desulfuricans]MDY0204608.1 NAD(P) transhydrogenase subunit alpha [Desulfovibrio desulfuricans]SPD35087.1 NAD(P) transhydrogenase [Desulfovibrio sp. G11]SPD35183.1 NAD(P) transhydrogenase [Desulfovibrio sp. G11]
MKFQGMTIGVPKEIMHGERRVSATPDTVKKMVADGATVLVEKGAGDGAFFADSAYVEAGGKIIEDVQEIFAKADVILKVKEPLFNDKVNKHEAEMVRDGQYLITFLHPAAPVNHEMMKKLAATGVISITLDGIPRISRAQGMDALTSMSTVAGYKGVLMAANRLAKFMPMVGTAVGVIKPANVLVIGTGVAGLQAVATAKRLGAVVTAVDIRPDAREQSMSLGAKPFDVGVPAEVAIGEGGYAQRLSDEWLNKEREALKPLVKDADIIILSALIPGKLAPILITKEMVASMAPGSSIVDISIDQGGNCELTEAGEVVVKHGVTIDGTKNIPGMMPTSSTWMFANNVYQLLAFLAQDGKIVLDRTDPIIESTLSTIDKQIVHRGAREAMGL